MRITVTQTYPRKTPLLCVLLDHKMAIDHISGLNDYLECDRCGARRVEAPDHGYSPIDYDWLKGNVT